MYVDEASPKPIAVAHTTAISYDIPLYNDNDRGGVGWWSAKPSMEWARHSACAVLVDDTILVMGGQGDRDCYSFNSRALDVIEQYTPATNQWRELKWTLPKPFIRIAAVYHRHTRTLMIIGVYHYATVRR